MRTTIGTLGLLLASLLAVTPAEAVVKGEDLPNETCARRETNGKLTTGACKSVCKGKTIYEPYTDAEVDAVSSNGGVCNAAAMSLPKQSPVQRSKGGPSLP